LRRKHLQKRTYGIVLKRITRPRHHLNESKSNQEVEVFHQPSEEITTDSRLLMWLTSQQRRQNFLVRYSSGGFELPRNMLASCAPPVRLCRLPGPLCLPRDRSGTLVLDDVAALDLDQQISLFDWLGRWSGDLRVISITATPLPELVEDGAFLEGLFHRLSTVQLDLTSEFWQGEGSGNHLSIGNARTAFSPDPNR
jgi:hypothetical protein